MVARKTLTVGAFFAIAALITSSALAQFSGSTSQGLFGQNSVGGSTATRTGGSTGGTGSGTNAQNPFAQQNVAAGAMANAPTITTTQQRGAFVGADTADTANARSQQGAQTRSAQSNFAQLGNLFAQGLQGVNQNNNQSRSQTPIRIGLKLGFRPQPISQTAAATFQTRLVKLPGIRFIGPADVTLEGRTAVLRGTVATEEDRQLAEALAMMEPAVLDVRNELVVDLSATAAEPLPLAPATSP